MWWYRADPIQRHKCAVMEFTSRQKTLAWWFEEISIFCIILICWSRICQPFSSIMSGYFLWTINYLPFSLKFPGSRVYKIYYSRNYARNIDWKALIIDKIPPKQVISTLLGYGRGSSSLCLLHFGVECTRVAWIKNSEGLKSQIPINIRLMGSQPFIAIACWKKHMKYDSLLRTQFLS